MYPPQWGTAQHPARPPLSHFRKTRRDGQVSTTVDPRGNGRWNVGQKGHRLKKKWAEDGRSLSNEATRMMVRYPGICNGRVRYVRVPDNKKEGYGTR